jgi:hypothetical protein
MKNITEAQNATRRKVEKHLIDYSAGEVTKALAVRYTVWMI